MQTELGVPSAGSTTQPIPYRAEDSRGAADYAGIAGITMLALLVILGLIGWLHKRGFLPFRATATNANQGKVIDRIPISRTTQLTVLEHQGARLAVVESPRGIAITQISDTRTNEH